MEDQRDILKNEAPFSYQRTKEGKVLIFWKSRQVLVANMKQAEQLYKAIEKNDPIEVQLCLARMTGNFKRGNERR
jgi:hypothetical protein